jgi:sodium-independent sulfate anion transporter 11
MFITNSGLKKSIKTGITDLPKNSCNYLVSLFPIFKWIHRYNINWFSGDALAGLTVGMLVIPQALSYAKLAGLPLEFGLYTSLVGVVVYCVFATSKDVTIGPTAVLSQLCGQVLATYNVGSGKVDPITFSIAVALVSGLLELFIGIFKLGIIVDFIPTPVIIGFTTGAAFQIIIGQIAGLLGISGINTNDPAYLVLYNILKSLHTIKLDASIGFASLVFLLLFRVITLQLIRKGYSWGIWVGQSANAITVILFTFISWIINYSKPTPVFKIVGAVPKGLNFTKLPIIPSLNNVLPAALAIVLVSVLEHVAVVKSFGRINGYTPDANQEIVALGLTNTLGSFLGAFSATGSFSRSSIKSRSGVKTPLAGIFTAVIVILALYVITPAFYYIPNSVLSAMIINAIFDLICRPTVVKELWDIEFLDFFILIVAFVVTIFVNIEMAIYSSVALAVTILLYRVARPKVQSLVRDEKGGWSGYDELKQDYDVAEFKPPPPGIAVFRIEESLSYPNSNYVSNIMKEWVHKYTRYNGGNLANRDQLWCEDSCVQSKGESESIWSSEANVLPLLHAVILDFSAVNNVDATGLQTLVDVRNQLERYAGQRVLFYFTHVHPQYRRVIDYFVLKLRPDITPVVATAQNDIADRPLEAIVPSRFIFRTIDQAVEDANRRLLTGVSAVSEASIETV